MSIISIIAAMDKNLVIGKGNQLPWHVSADLQYFKKNTLTKPIIMGRETFTSIGKPLPNRRNIVVTRNIHFQEAGIEVAHSLIEAIDIAKNAPEIMIIGGATIFKQALPFAQRMYLTIIDHAFDGDTYFPLWNEKEWRTVSSTQHKADDQSPYDLNFLILER